jgi:hypothetical protein
MGKAVELSNDAYRQPEELAQQQKRTVEDCDDSSFRSGWRSSTGKSYGNLTGIPGTILCVYALRPATPAMP